MIFLIFKFQATNEILSTTASILNVDILIKWKMIDYLVFQEKLEIEKQEIQNRDDLILKLKNTSLKTHGSPQKVLKDYNSKVGKNINKQHS